MYFAQDEEARIRETVSALEAKTGAQVLAVVVGKSDAYPETPWKAFALAASISALVLALHAALDPPWPGPLDAALGAAAVLGLGAAAALLTTLLPAFARLFLASARLEGEVDQYARALFLERELFRTRRRTGVLILISLFERKVVVLPDSGVAARVDAATLQEVARRMTAHLARGARFAAVMDGLAALETTLLRAGFAGTPGAPDEIADEWIEEKGEGK